MQKIFIPTQCPCCSYALETVNEQLFCRNLACDAQLGKKLEHFCKVLQIKGFGPKTIEKLNLRDITEIFYLELPDVSAVLGEKTAVKLLNEIERAKQADLATVLASFSIHLIGATAADKICKVVSSIEEITADACKQAGLGDKATASLLDWLELEYPEMKEFLPFSFKSTVKVVDTNAKKVCITGRLKSYKKKADAESVLKAAGYILVDSVTKSTDYLIDEEDKMSAKREKAVQYGIKIITDINVLLKEIKND